jgi:hypothetical protein
MRLLYLLFSPFQERCGRLMSSDVLLTADAHLCLNSMAVQQSRQFAFTST